MPNFAFLAETAVDDLVIEDLGPLSRRDEAVPLLCFLCVAPGPVSEGAAAAVQHA